MMMVLLLLRGKFLSVIVVVVLIQWIAVFLPIVGKPHKDTVVVSFRWIMTTSYFLLVVS
jgi:hypothetical protein